MVFTFALFIPSATLKWHMATCADAKHDPQGAVFVFIVCFGTHSWAAGRPDSGGAGAAVPYFVFCRLSRELKVCNTFVHATLRLQVSSSSSNSFSSSSSTSTHLEGLPTLSIDSMFCQNWSLCHLASGYTVATRLDMRSPFRCLIISQKSLSRSAR